jgi:hypothetical protein
MITDGAIMVSPRADCSVAPSAVIVGGQRLVEFGVQGPRSTRYPAEAPVRSLMYPSLMVALGNVIRAWSTSAAG